LLRRPVASRMLISGAAALKTEAPHEARLQETAGYIAAQVGQHILAGNRGLLVANAAPGIGKLSAAATLGTSDGDPLDLAWIAERRDIVNQVAALGQYRPIAPCTRHTCPDGHPLHALLGERGYNTWSVHK